MTLIGLIGADYFICDHLFDLCYLCCVFLFHFNSTLSASPLHQVQFSKTQTFLNEKRKMKSEKYSVLFLVVYFCGFDACNKNVDDVSVS